MTEERPYYVTGIALPDTPDPGHEQPWKQTQIVGKPMCRVDAYERVSGSAVYPSDIILPDMLYGAILGCPHPHALVKTVNVAEAEKLKGVRCIISQSTPGTDLKWSYQNAKTKLFDPHCRFEGEAVAAVAAETPYQAWDAVNAIEVGYQVLPFVADERKALEPKAALVHGKSNRVGDVQKYQRGDVEAGFSQADVVLEQEYRTECEIHTPLELHGCVAKWDGDLLTVWESTQGVYAVQTVIARVLGLPMAKVRVIGNYVGGGFGSKLQTRKYSIIAALLAKKTARPVKLFLSREETYLTVGNRPAGNMRLKAGIKKNGTLTALDFSCIGTGGAYPGGGVQLVDWLIRDLYACPNVRTECTDVYTNAGVSCPFRAPGHPQGSWALEQMIDALAIKIGMDPLDVRLKNIPLYSQGRDGNPPYTTTGFKECLEQGAKAFGWIEKKKRAKTVPGDNEHVRRGIGMAGCLWFAGGGGKPSTVIVKLFSDGSANLNMGASDIGTGTKTVMAMVVAEELGVKLDDIQIENADTGTTQFATPSGGSKTVPTEAPTVRAAALQIKKQLLKMASKDLKVARLMIKDGRVLSVDDPSKSLKITEISELKSQGVIVGVGYRGPNPKDKAISPFAAHFCEVNVNMNTGETEIVRFVAAQESGRVMNRLTFDNQVYGGVTMGIGFATTEARILDVNETGKLCNRNWHDYKLPTALDVPADMLSVPIDRPDPEANSTGAKGLGEPANIAAGAAIANAIYDATGIRVADTPINPVQLSRLLAEKRKER
ncbi:MAG TPA: xanthine dehydrogenase family protein molybdopterin-binding subunit [Desulfomonilaceae bacterium]|nr:xanthine dehydrogenase family protein molybdopterin-binding subunit [Desulfomonilaceae bacterium]